MDMIRRLLGRFRKPGPWQALAQNHANFAAEPEPVQFGEMVELSDLEANDEQIIAVQVMRPGTFIEKSGRPVTITDADQDEYKANFEAGVAGQQVPVNIGHPAPADRAAAPAASWYKRLYFRTIDGVRRLWSDQALSDIGLEAIASKRYKYFSPSLDMARKVIRGGGFVNYPAIKGQPAMELAEFLTPVTDDQGLRAKITEILQSLGRGTPPKAQPIELSEDTTMELTEAQIEELKATERTKVLAELTEKQGEMDDFAEGIRKEAREEAWAQFTEQQKIKTEVAEFSASITGGDSGLSVEADVVTEFLIGLTPEQREQAKKLLDVKVADFSERGHKGNGATGLKELPAPVAAALKMDLQRSPTDPGKTVMTFMTANLAQLGPMADYNLSAFMPAE